MMISTDRLAEIEKLTRDATEELEMGVQGICYVDEKYTAKSEAFIVINDEPSNEFVKQSRDIVLELLAEVRRLQLAPVVGLPVILPSNR